LNEVYSFTGFNGLPLPIDATYDDLTEYRFAISPVIISDLVINVIRLETPIIDLKLAASNLSLYSIALNSNISEPKIVNSDLVLGVTTLFVDVEIVSTSTEWTTAAKSQWRSMSESDWRGTN
jgi:hypothetical protein